MYKLNKNIVGSEVNSVIRLEDGAVIPMNPDNTDYQAYLAWVDQGNQPLPADEVTNGN